MRIKEYWNLIGRELFLAITCFPSMQFLQNVNEKPPGNDHYMINMDSQRPKIGDSWSFTSLYLQHWVTTPKKQVVLQNQLKACVCYFWSIFFSPNDSPSKTEMFFISSKDLFSFSRYSNFCIFYSSFPLFSDSKGKMEVE